MEKCFYCKGDLEDSITNYMADIDGHFIIIKNVPCHKCQNCGEISYSGVTIERIEKIIDRLKTVAVEVSVVEYAA